MQWRFSGRWLSLALVVLVAIGSSVTGIRNHFAQDDTALISEDTRVHSLENVPKYFTTSYWPPPFNPTLYRPLATTSFALQWALGGGDPIVFRLTSYLLYALAALGVYFLGRRLFSQPVGLAIAVLFAAHPVHVEAVALAVNQGELWVGVLSLVATNLYVDRRRQGWLAPRDWGWLLAFYGLACLFKEHAIIMPGFLLAAEVLLIQPQAGARMTDRLRRLWPGFAALALLGVAFLAVRSRVLGDFVGEFTAEGIDGQSLPGRMLTMLQVVPRWVGLLIWPSHLQGDYSPAVINQATTWGWAQTIGAAILVGVAVLLAVTWRRAPVVAFGILWAGGALLPVSNLLIPVGIVLAERTLFLPSVGFLLACGGLAQYLLAGRSDPTRVARLMGAGVTVLATLGVWRSAIRHPDYRSQVYYWAQTVRDAPLSYRAHHANADILWKLDYGAASIVHFHTAIALYPKAWWIRNDLANRFRLKGDCYPALELYEQSLEIEPDQPEARASRIACLVHLGRYEEAIAEAQEAITRGRDVEDFLAYRATADSARRAGAPPGEVRMTTPEAAVRQ